MFLVAEDSGPIVLLSWELDGKAQGDIVGRKTIGGEITCLDGWAH